MKITLLICIVALFALASAITFEAFVKKIEDPTLADGVIPLVHSI